MRLLAPLVCAVLLLAGCTGGSDVDDAAAGDSPTAAEITFASLDLDWDSTGDVLDAGDPPGVPDGFDEDRYDRMAEALTTWATATTVTPDVRTAQSPAGAVADDLPAAIGDQITAYAGDAATPRLSAANVFADDVTVEGDPQVTTAWDAKVADVDGAPSLTLRLQTRAAYEVRVAGGPIRVIGVLRVHSLITREAAQGDIGVGYAWQEYGASDCIIATDDALRPDGDAKAATADLATFVKAGDADGVEMPELAPGDEVDEEYLERCKAAAV